MSRESQVRQEPRAQVKLCNLEPSLPAPEHRGIIHQIILDSGRRAYIPSYIVIGANKDGGNDHAYLHYNHPQHAEMHALATYKFFLAARPVRFGVVIIPRLHKLGERRELKELVPYHGPPLARQQNTNFYANTSRFANTNTCAHQNTHIDQIHRKMKALESNVAELHNAMKEGAWSMHQGDVLHDIMGDYNQSTEDFST